MRDTEQKNGREFVLGRQGTSERHGTERYENVCVEFLYRAKRVALTDGPQIIGDSLFLLTFPSHILFQFTQPIYRCSIGYLYPKLRSIFLRRSSIFSAIYVSYI